MIIAFLCKLLANLNPFSPIFYLEICSLYQCAVRCSLLTQFGQLCIYIDTVCWTCLKIIRIVSLLTWPCSLAIYTRHWKHNFFPYLKMWPILFVVIHYNLQCCTQRKPAYVNGQPLTNRSNCTFLRVIRKFKQEWHQGVFSVYWMMIRTKNFILLSYHD